MPLPAAPTLTPTDMTLEWPSTGDVVKKVFLPTPDFGNTDTLAMMRVNRATRAGTRRVFKHGQWNHIESKIYDFTNLTKAHREALVGFMRDTLGQEILLTDYEGRQWKGVLDPSDESADGGRNMSHTFSLNFEVTSAV